MSPVRFVRNSVAVLLVLLGGLFLASSRTGAGSVAAAAIAHP